MNRVHPSSPPRSSTRGDERRRRRSATAVVGRCARRVLRRRTRDCERRETSDRIRTVVREPRDECSIAPCNSARGFHLRARARVPTVPPGAPRARRKEWIELNERTNCPRAFASRPRRHFALTTPRKYRRRRLSSVRFPPPSPRSISGARLSTPASRCSLASRRTRDARLRCNSLPVAS